MFFYINTDSVCGRYFLPVLSAVGFSYNWNKIPFINNWRRKNLFFSWFQRVQSMDAWPQALGQNWCRRRRWGSFSIPWQTGNREGADENQIQHSKACPSDILTAADPHLPKFPLPPKIVPPTQDQVFNTWALGWQLTFKPLNRHRETNQ